MWLFLKCLGKKKNHILGSMWKNTNPKRRCINMGTIKYRPHRGTLRESIKEMKTFDTVDAMVTFSAIEWPSMEGNFYAELFFDEVSSRWQWSPSWRYRPRRSVGQQCGMCFISIVNACRMLNRLRRGKQPVHTCGKNRPNLARWRGRHSPRTSPWRGCRAEPSAWRNKERNLW